MTTIVDTSQTAWPCQAELSGRREAAHAKMQLLASYLDQLGLTRVPLDVDYNTDGDETEIPAYVDTSTTGKSAWMRFDWSDNTFGKPPIVLYFSVWLDYFYNYYSSQKKPRYMLMCVVRATANDSDPLLASNFISHSMPSGVSSSTIDRGNVVEKPPVGDIFCNADDRLYLGFCINSITGNAASPTNWPTIRSALSLYIERTEYYDAIFLENALWDGTSMAGRPMVVDNLGSFAAMSVAPYLANNITSVLGKVVVQKLPIVNATDYIELDHAYIAGRDAIPDFGLVRLDFTGEEKPYLSVFSQSYRPTDTDDATMLIEWEDA